MILIIAGTNRPNSKTRIVSEYIYNTIKDVTNEEVAFYSLEDMPASVLHAGMYEAEGQDSELSRVQDDYIIPADKWIVVSPEYNGSFSGILKLFLDALSIRKYSSTFKGKEVALLGVSSGRAGNLRGMEHLTGFMHYLGMHVYPTKLPISSISTALDENNVPTIITQAAINALLESYLKISLPEVVSS